MISIKNLSLSYGKNLVLQNLDIEFEEGITHGIVGLNGAGKTSFFHLLSGYIKPDSGSILRNGQALHYREVEQLESSNFFYSRITGREYLDIFPQKNPHFDIELLNRLLQLPLDELAENYSTGMKKKLAICALLKQDKEINVLDEPFNGLDLETVKIMELMLEQMHSRGKTIFISSHILQPLLHACERIHLLQKGVFVKSYRPAEYGELEKSLFVEVEEKARDILPRTL